MPLKIQIPVRCLLTISRTAASWPSRVRYLTLSGEGTEVLEHVGNLWHHDAVSHPRRIKSSAQWKPGYSNRQDFIPWVLSIGLKYCSSGISGQYISSLPQCLIKFNSGSRASVWLKFFYAWRKSTYFVYIGRAPCVTASCLARGNSCAQCRQNNLETQHMGKVEM
jgi:hypothetical protein